MVTKHESGSYSIQYITLLTQFHCRPKTGMTSFTIFKHDMILFNKPLARMLLVSSVYQKRLFGNKRDSILVICVHFSLLLEEEHPPTFL